MERQCCSFSHTVQFSHRCGLSSHHGFDDGAFFVVELVLVVVTGGGEDVEGVVVVAGEELCAVLGGGEVELVVDGVVLEEVAEFGFDALLQGHGHEGLVGVAHVPHLHSQVIPCSHILAFLDKLRRRVARNKLRKEVLLRGLFSRELQCVIKARAFPHITHFQRTLIRTQ